MMLKIRKTAASLVAAAVLMCSFTAVRAESGYKLVIDGTEAALSKPVVFNEGYNLAPVAEILRILGAQVSFEPHSKTVTANKGGIVISFTIGAPQAYVNGVQTELALAPRIIDETAYVPVGFIAEALGYGVEWNANSKTIKLTAPGVAGVETERLDVTFKNRYSRNLSYSRAYGLAKAHSKDLRTLRNTMRDAQSQRDELADTYAGMGLTSDGIATAWVVEASAAALSTLSALDKLDLSLQSEKYQTEIYEGAIAASIKGSFLAIEELQNNIALTEAQIELSKMALNNSKLMLELGMISEVDYEKAELEHKKLADGQASNERSLESEYVALNKLLGYAAGVRYNIVADSEYIPLEDGFLLENYVTRMIGISPTIILSQLSLEQAERNARLTVGSTPGELERARTAVNTATLNLEDTKNNYEKSIRSAYYSLKNTETQIASAELDLKKAKTDEETAKVQYETGSITRLELLQRMYAADAAEKGIELAKKGYNFSKFRFNNPFLL